MTMMIRGVTAGLLALAFMLPAVAGGSDEDNWNRCMRQDIAGPQKPEDVIAACRRVLNAIAFAANDRADAFNNIGASHMDLHEYDDAIRYFGEALRAIREYQNIPEYIQLANYSRRNRASAYILTGKYDAALADIDQLAAREPIPRYIAMRCRAHALWDANFATALPDCKKAIDTDKTLTDAFAGWLIVEYRQGKYADVVADCKLVQDQGATSPDVLYVCGLAEKRAGNAERGRMMIDESESAAGDVAATFKKLGILP